jgi:hypothetical protein
MLLYPGVCKKARYYCHGRAAARTAFHISHVFAPQVMQLYGTRSLEAGTFLRADYVVCTSHLQRVCTGDSHHPRGAPQIRTRDTAFKRVVGYQRYASGVFSFMARQ